MRIGHGYDVHTFEHGRKLILGGVLIPCEYGLLGHSDADVLAHALTDALFGAAGLADIGAHFPPNDPTYEGADSIELLKQAYCEVKEKGFIIENADCTVVAEKPHIMKYIPAMREALAKALGIETQRINIKATTEEGLGLAGKGIGAHALVLLNEKG